MSHAAPILHESRRGYLVALVVILLLTAAIVLAWGHYKPLDQDEIFVLQTDSVASVRTLIDVQRHWPISLDPLFYHLLGHASIKLFGANAFAIRLPSLVGYLLMQVCLFCIARRLADVHAAVIAAAVPALTATLFYGVEARPYGVLLGLATLVLLNWQSAVREGANSRIVALVTLAVALAMTLNTHYFAVLLLIPLYMAELFRTVMASARKKHSHVDWPVIAAIVCGSAGIVFTLPFQLAAGEFRKHYYNAGSVSLHAITQSYRALIVNYTTYSVGVQRVAGALLVTFTLLLLWAVWQQARGGTQVRSAEWVYLAVLAAMPLFGYLLARFVTHSIEVRYVLPAIIAVALLIAIAAGPLLRSSRRYAAVLVLLLVAIAASGIVRVREEREKQANLIQSLTITPQLHDALLSTPAARLYVQNLGFFDEIARYLPADIRSRTILLYSREQELRWLQHDTTALTALHMQHFTAVPTEQYEVLRQQPGTSLLLLHPDGWEWVEKALAQDRARQVPLGAALGGTLVAVRFHTEGRQAP